MKKNSGSIIYSSPGTPEYYLGETPKYWRTNNTKTPKNVPSKWEDAERWINSPISGDGSFKSPVALPRRRHKSKSGPLSPADLSNYSPALKTDVSRVQGLSISDSLDDKLGERSSVSPPTSIINLVAHKLDQLRDVEVDTTPKPSKPPTNDIGALHSPWDGDEALRSTLQIQREEAKITAWENLQKAKAKTKIRQLEMKLERKRSASMERILNKLSAAQTKAQATRNLLSKEPRISRMGFSCCSCVDMCTLSNSYVRRRN